MAIAPRGLPDPPAVHAARLCGAGHHRAAAYGGGRGCRGRGRRGHGGGVNPRLGGDVESEFSLYPAWDDPFGTMVVFANFFPLVVVVSYFLL